MRFQRLRRFGAAILLIASAAALGGCHSDSTNSTARNPANADDSAGAAGAGGPNAGPSANPADYNSAISARQRDLIQAHKNR